MVAFGRRHVWPVSAAATALIVSATCGIVVSVDAMIRGPFLAGYFGAAACGDLLIWGGLIIAALWLPRRRAPTA